MHICTCSSAGCQRWQLRVRPAVLLRLGFFLALLGCCVGAAQQQGLGFAGLMGPDMTVSMLTVLLPCLQFERTLIVAEEGSKVSYLEGCTAPSYDKNQVWADLISQLHEFKQSEVCLATLNIVLASLTRCLLFCVVAACLTKHTCGQVGYRLCLPGTPTTPMPCSTLRHEQPAVTIRSPAVIMRIVTASAEAATHSLPSLCALQILSVTSQSG